jgi:carbon monoxide dehydrogenase subunit G
MWALIKDNKIEQIYQRPKSLVIGEVRYPSNMFTKYTDAEKAAIGIYPVEDSGTKGNDRFEYTSQATYSFSASDKKVTTSYTITAKSLVDVNDVDEDGNAVLDYKGNQRVTLGLKSIAKNQAKETANSLIKRFNWLVERLAYDSSATIPSAVGTYVGDIKTDCAAIEAAIDGASDMAAFKALYEDTRDSDGNVTEVARINRWSDDYDVKQYVR